MAALEVEPAPVHLLHCQTSHTTRRILSLLGTRVYLPCDRAVSRSWISRLSGAREGDFNIPGHLTSSPPLGKQLESCFKTSILAELIIPMPLPLSVSSPTLPPAAVYASKPQREVTHRS